MGSTDEYSAVYLARHIVLLGPGVQSLGRVPEGPVCKHPGAAVWARQANADGVWVSYLFAPHSLR